MPSHIRPFGDWCIKILGKRVGNVNGVGLERSVELSSKESQLVKQGSAVPIVFGTARHGLARVGVREGDTVCGWPGFDGLLILRSNDNAWNLVGEAISKGYLWSVMPNSYLDEGSFNEDPSQLENEVFEVY